MAKQIVFTYEDKEYTLEFTRRTVKQMEDEGFVAQDIDRKPMTLLPALFAGAFKAHHRFVKQDVIDKIYAGMPHKDELIGKLAEMYNDPIVTLMEEPDEKAVKNVSWEANWLRVRTPRLQRAAATAACPLFIVTGKLLKNSAVIT